MNNQKKKKATATGVLLAALMSVSILLPVPVFAGGNVPVTVDIKVTYTVDGNAETAAGDRFTLAADDHGAPMPEGAVDGRKTITIPDEGSFSFGDIRFERPDVFWYTITREVSGKKGVVKDGSEYRAKVIALNDGRGYVLVYKKGSSEKQELVYRDRTTPATGEDNSIIIYSVTAAAAAAGLAVFAGTKKRSRKKGKLRNFICILAAVMVFFIATPSAAADEICTEEVPDSGEVSITEETEVTPDGYEEETDAETVQEGYVTMKAVSGNISVTK